MGNLNGGMIANKARIINPEVNNICVDITETTRLIDDNDHENEIPVKPQHRYTYVKLCSIVLLANLSFNIAMTTQTVLYESVYCQQWYDAHPKPTDQSISENICKIPEVQKSIANLKAYQAFFDGIPSLLVAIPLGVAIDMFGRRRFFCVNITTILVQQLWIALVCYYANLVDLRWIWAQGILTIFSGGNLVAEMMFACILSDITPEEKLNTTFLKLGALSAASQVIGPLITGTLVRLNPWWAVAVYLSFFAITVMITFTIPETHLLRDNQQERNLQDASPSQTESKQRWRTLLRRTRKELDDFKLLWTDWRLIVLLCLLPLRNLGTVLNQLLQLYVSNRYGWTLADATFLYSVQACAMVVFLFCILPYIADYVRRSADLSPTMTNAVFLRANLLLAGLSYSVEGLAPTAALFVVGLMLEALSGGLDANSRSLVMLLIDPKDKGRVFSVFAIFETLSSMLAYPMMASLLNTGLERGGEWIGLPYGGAALAVGVGFVVACVTQFR